MSAEDPFTQTQYYTDAEVLHDPNIRICFIFISNFFDDQTNLICYIRGTNNLKMFLGGMYGMQAFNGPLLFAVSPYDSSRILQYIKGISLPRGHKDRVIKSNAQLPLNKWRYIYETGRLAWEKSEVDLEKTKELMEMRSHAKDVGTAPLTDYDTNIDPGDGKEAISTYSIESNDTLQSIELAMSVEIQGDVKTMEQREHRSPKEDEKEAGCSINSGTFDTHLKGSVSEAISKPSREPEIISGLQKADLWRAGDPAILETYEKTNQLDGVNETWASPRDNARPNRPSGISQDISREDLNGQAVFLSQCEIDLAHKKAAASNISGGLKRTAELAELERNIAIDRFRLVQCFASASAQKWKVYKNVISGDLRSLQDTKATKQHMRKRFIGMLLYEGQDESLEVTNKLKIGDIQVLLNLVDNIELQKECLKSVEALNNNEANPEELAYLVDFGNNIHVYNEKHIAKLATALSKNRTDDPTRNVSCTTNQGKIISEGLSDYQEDLVAQIMGSTNENEHFAANLLQKSLWSVDAAVAWWYGDSLGLENNRETPTSVCSGINPLRSIPKNMAKRSYVVEAGPSRHKKQKTGKEREKTKSPEDLNTARARLERIIAKESTAQLEQENQPYHSKNHILQEYPVGLKRSAQDKLSVLPGTYSLELLNKMITDEANAQAEGLQSKEVTDSNIGLESFTPKSPIVPVALAASLLSGKQYDIKDRGQKADYNDSIGKLELLQQETMPAREKALNAIQKMDRPGEKRENFAKLQQGQSSPQSASLPSFGNLLRSATTAFPASALSTENFPQTTTITSRNTPKVISDVKGRIVSEEELETLVKALPVPYIYSKSPTATDFTADSKVSNDQDLDLEGECPTLNRWQSKRSDTLPSESEEYQASMRKTHHFTEQTTEYVAKRYVVKRKQTFNQPFVPASPPVKSGTGLLGPGEGMNKALKFIRSGVFTLAPQGVSSVDRLENATPSGSLSGSLSRRESPIVSQNTQDVSLLSPLTGPSYFPSIPLQSLQQEALPLEQSSQISNQAAQSPSTAPRDPTPLDTLFTKHEATNNSTVSLNESAAEVSNTAKIDKWRKDSAQRLSVESAAALVRTLVNTDTTAHATNQSQGGTEELGKIKVRFTDEYRTAGADTNASNCEENRAHSMVDEGISEAKCPRE